MASLVFDPNKMTYMDYLNSLSGYRPLSSLPEEPRNPFPAETTNPAPPVRPTPPSTPAVVNPALQGAAGAQVVNQAYNWLNPSPTQALSSNMSPVPPVGANMTSAATGQPVVAPGTALPAEGMLANAPAAFATYGIPAAAVAATAMGANSAIDSFKKGKESGSVREGIRSGFDSGSDAATAFATGGLSIPANLAAGIAGGLSGGMGRDQQRRSRARDSGVASGWLDNNFQVPLESGTLNLANDGGYRYTNAAGESRPVYDIDWNDPNAAQAVGWLNPIGAILAAGDEKVTSDMTAQIYNELTKDGTKDLATIRKRVVELYNFFKLKPSLAIEAINAMNLSPDRKAAFLGAIENLRPGRDFQIKPGGEKKDPRVVVPMGTGAMKKQGTVEDKRRAT